MTAVRWTTQALEDVEAIREFIARDSPRYADLTVERLVGSVDRLQQFPRSGRVVPEHKDPALREVILGSYRIVYRSSGAVVEILTVFHSARVFPLIEDE